MMALADAATAAEAAKMMALAEAATAAAEAHAAALAEAATAAAEAHAAALATALAEAATMAAADQAEALRIAAEAADAAQAMALAEAATAADAAQAMALAEAATAADAAQAMALAEAATAADAKLMAVNTGLLAALQELDLEPASDTMSVEDQIAANTATIKNELARVRIEAKDILAANAAAAATKMAKAVHGAIGVNSDPATTQPAAPMVTVKASSTGVVAATQLGYTMSSSRPDGITGWRGATLKKDGDTTVIYSNIADSVATEIGDIYGAASDPGEPEHFDVTADTAVEDGTPTAHDIPWSEVKRADDKSITTDGDDAKTTFVGSVSGLPGTFTCTVGDCDVPSGDDLTSSDAWTFVPDNANGKIDVPDSAHVSFGWWLNATSIADEYEFDAFANATGMGEARGVAGSLKDSATYKGGAAGKWAMQSTTDDSASGGHFTANATLTANFDADNTPDSGDGNDELGVSIGGTITDFMTGDVSWTLLTKVETSCDRILIAGGANVEAEWEQGPAV